MEYKYTAKDILIALLKSLAYILVWFAVQYIAVFVAEFAILLTHRGISGDEAYNILISHSVLLTLLSNVATVLIIVLFYKIRNKQIVEKMNLYNTPKNVLISSLLLGLATQVVIIILLSYLPIPNSWIEDHNDNYAEIAQTTFSFVTILTVVIVAPIVEEIIFRGLVLNRLCRVMPKWPAIIISALAFGAVHGELFAFVYASAIGILMGFIFTKFDSVLPTILFHMGYNGFSLILTLFVDLPVLLLLVVFGSFALFVYEMVCIIRYPSISNVPIAIDVLPPSDTTNNTI